MEKKIITVDPDKIFIIAEAGVNHNGDRRTAFELVDAAVSSGANAVKFQTFKASKLVTKYAKKAKYQIENTAGNNTQLEMLKKLELSENLHFELKEYCDNKGIEFLSTAFDISSLKFLSDNLKLKVFKIPSGEITNTPLLLEFALKKRKMILSTGMSNLSEIKDALSVLAFGLIQSDQINNKIEELTSQKLSDAYNSDEGRRALLSNVTLLHCITEYPAPLEDVNLRAIGQMREKFGLPVGFSDHTDGYLASIAAVSVGACMIEKHFTLDKNAKGPDHKASLDPSNLKRMVDEIRLVEKMQGDGEKKAMPSELKNIVIARKSIVAACEIRKGETFTIKNLTTKRPGNGIPPIQISSLIGTRSKRSYQQDEMI